MTYVEAAATGIVHKVTCGRVRPATVYPYDPAKRHLLPGRTPCPACLPHGLPEE